jgi:Family of unknown function (DUF5338)
MSESLSTRVARFVQTQPARRSGKARAAVIALRAEIEQAVNDGWPVRSIWQTLRAEGAVQVGYHAFRRHVAELVLQQPTEHGRRPTPPPEPSHRPAAPVTRTEGKPRAFHHDRMPRKDKIYG